MQDSRFEPLPSEVRRRKEQASLEATIGTTWVDSCPAIASAAILSALRQLTNASGRVLRDAYTKLNLSEDQSVEQILEGEGSDVLRLDAVAAICSAFVWRAKNDRSGVLTSSWADDETIVAVRYESGTFFEVVNDALLHSRVGWMVEDGRFQERGNSVLHSEIVRPATLLLDSDPVFATAARSFLLALDRLAENKPDVAITDVATSLQEFFRALGVQGNSVSSQLDSAINLGILAKADRGLLKPLVDWVNADRSTRGNAHHIRAGVATKADAWLTIHVVGALMVRLSTRQTRVV